MTDYPGPFEPTWHDNGETSELCPVPFCGKNLYWSNYYSAEHHKVMRRLICKQVGCSYRSRNIDAAGPKGWTHREWLKTRER